MGDLNSVVLCGRLTKDPELRYTQEGKAVAQFTIAVNRTYGENNKADFIGCVAWEKTAELAVEYLGKGRKVIVEGSIRHDSWQDDQGKWNHKTKVTVYRLHFMEKREEKTPEQQQSNIDELAHKFDEEEKETETKQGELVETNESGEKDPFLSEMPDDEIPF